MLLDHGANINSLNDHGMTPFTDIDSYQNRKVIVKELAKMSFENQYICSENIKFLSDNETLHQIFIDCLIELQKMKDCRFSVSLSLFDILKMRNDSKLLVKVMNDEDFINIEELEFQWLVHYRKDLQKIIKKSLIIKDS